MFGNRQKMESMEKEIMLLRREIVELKLQVQTLSSKLQDQNNVAHKTELVQKKPRASGSSTLINPDYSQDCMFRPIPITHFGSIRSLISV